MKFLITGGAGFIGSAVIRHLLEYTDHRVINVDKLTYAGNLESLNSCSNSNKYSFNKIDICNEGDVFEILNIEQPNVVMHLAAESHVDRSIDRPSDFIKTNILGTYNLLEATKELTSKGIDVLFHHISTDEVFGDLDNSSTSFNEETPYDPSSPYSASKACSDHLVRSWGRTFDLPFVITNCSNNYGPYQFPEKLIPITILKALNKEEIPIYGDGLQIRDWLYVEDHAKALIEVATAGESGQTYNIGAENQKTNLEVVENICSILDELHPYDSEDCSSYKELIRFVKDRPGHDRRYAINPSKINKQLKWKAQETFQSGLIKTVKWYIENDTWIKNILNGNYVLDRQGL